jgi:lactoylglutathione lyase
MLKAFDRRRVARTRDPPAPWFAREEAPPVAASLCDAPPIAGRFRDCFAILQVSDLRRSLGFYRDLLGFELTYTFPTEQDAEFASLAVEGGALALARADRPVESASTSIWVYTDDVDTAVDELRAAGVRVVAEPADQPWGERVASVADPDGYVVHIGAPTATS